ncbi:MAG TPA: DUF167 domain-containing protein, partial [Gemmatimonadales bacterium]|nr:DUF167 domain-containing protein [Gemmatimonadales bacterium]
SRSCEHLTARLVVHVVPRAARTAVAGRHGDAVKIRIAAAPVDGAANDELIRFLAERLRISRTAIEITAGHTSRRKNITITGMETATVLRLLEGE